MSYAIFRAEPTTSSQPLILAVVGSSTILAGYAKLAVTNG